jgi:hypothetical protein
MANAPMNKSGSTGASGAVKPRQIVRTIEIAAPGTTSTSDRLTSPHARPQSQLIRKGTLQYNPTNAGISRIPQSAPINSGQRIVAPARGNYVRDVHNNLVRAGFQSWTRPDHPYYNRVLDPTIMQGQRPAFGNDRMHYNYRPGVLPISSNIQVRNIPHAVLSPARQRSLFKPMNPTGPVISNGLASQVRNNNNKSLPSYKRSKAGKQG